MKLQITLSLNRTNLTIFFKQLLPENSSIVPIETEQARDDEEETIITTKDEESKYHDQQEIKHTQIQSEDFLNDELFEYISSKMKTEQEETHR